MKRQIAVLGLALATLLSAPSAFAYSSPGAPTGYVNDFAQVLSAETTQSLENELTQFEASTSNEIAVAIVPAMGGDYIENYAVKLFEEWKIGKKDKDNGVLLVLSVAERQMRIEVGYGLEGALPDSVAQSILNTEMTPRLKAGDYDGAVQAGVRAIEEATRGEYVSSGESRDSASTQDYFYLFFVLPLFFLQLIGSILARSKSWWAGGVIGAVGGVVLGWVFALGLVLALPLVLILALLGLGFDYMVSRAYTNSKLLGISPPWWAGGGRGGGGGGFGGFGGGSSGGGGASGSW